MIPMRVAELWAYNNKNFLTLAETSGYDIFPSDTVDLDETDGFTHCLIFQSDAIKGSIVVHFDDSSFFKHSSKLIEASKDNSITENITPYAAKSFNIYPVLQMDKPRKELVERINEMQQIEIYDNTINMPSNLKP